MSTREPKAGKRVTMVDVAKAAGCSQATVSLVLNNVTDIKISAELRMRILKLSRTMGYGQRSLIVPPALQTLKGGSIGFLVDQLGTTPEAIHAIDGATEEALDNDVTILIAQTLGRPEKQDRAIERFVQAGVRGIICMSFFTREISIPTTLSALTMPVVLLNCYEPSRSFAAVIPDEISGGHRATAHLIDAGHRRIATIVGERFMEASEDRQRGYRRALDDAGIPFDPSLVIDGDWTVSSGYAATRRLLGSPRPPTAIFCQNDKMAMGCYSAIRDSGLSVPGDISVVGYDDDELCRHLQPQLTSVDLPHRGMGAWAARRIAEILDGRTASQERLTLECVLVSRESVKRLQ